MDPRDVRCKALKQVTVTAGLGDLVDVDESLDSFPLCIVIAEAPTRTEPVIGSEPMIEEEPARIGRALVPFPPPGSHGLSQRGHARSRSDPRLKELALLRTCFCAARHVLRPPRCEWS